MPGTSTNNIPGSKNTTLDPDWTISLKTNTNTLRISQVSISQSSHNFPQRITPAGEQVQNISHLNHD